MESVLIHDPHALPASEVVQQLASDIDQGLTPEEAARRLAHYGPNAFAPKRRRGPFLRFLLQFHHPLIYILLATAVITGVLQEWVDSGVILGVVVVNALIGFVQESRAEQAIESLKKMLAPSAMVLRAATRTVVPAVELVPGDVVFLQAGDKVPADLRLCQVKNLRIDEAPLTGESVPVQKGTAPLAKETPVADRLNVAFSGALVTFGQGTGVVVATGEATEIGKIAGALEEVHEIETPLTKRLVSFSKGLTVAILLVAGLLFFLGVLQGKPLMEMFMAAVALAVSAIPEGLPAIMTITLAIGVKRMAARHAIIRKLPAVETLGSTTVICSDKTGTLTRNEMTVTAIEAVEGRFRVSGVGYTPVGAVVRDNGQALTPADGSSVMELLRAGLLCNEAALKKEADEWKMEGDPTEGALIVLAEKAGLNPEHEKRLQPRTDVIPFDSEQQFMATLHHNRHEKGIIYLKGAPERVLPLCRAEWGVEVPLQRSAWETKARTLASEGLRVLALCAKPVPAEHKELELKDVDAAFSLLGLVGMIDPPREEAIAAVEKCRTAGIRVKMITGDHVETARAVARQLGIGDGKTISGVDIDRMPDEAAFSAVASSADVFARVTPAHKLRLVQALQQHGEVVAMTGDGVNDAPALKQADIGIAMGITGTEVSKEAADMVLADDNFASIERAVEEGRTVFNNLKKALLFILPTNGGECLTLIAAIAAGALLPVLPLHILWINLVTTVALAITLAFEPVEAGTMSKPPRRPDAPLIDRVLVWKIVFVSALMAAGAFGLFFYELSLGTGLDVSRTVAVNAIVFFEVFYLFNTRSLTDSILNRQGLCGNPLVLLGIATVVVLQAAFTYWPVMHMFFHTAPLDGVMWVRILAVSVGLLLLVETEKAILRKVTSGMRRNEQLSQGTLVTKIPQLSGKGTKKELERKEGRA
jgi:magnesium-transporting ATPase (P-type)